MAKKELNVLPNSKLFLRRIIENIEGDLVADTAAAEELIRRNLRQDLVQSLVQ
jgi:hypothetical protein